MERSHARGFSLIEVIISVAVAVVLAWLLFHALSQALLAARMQSADDLEQSTVGRLINDLTTEEDDAWAIYTPPTDVLGKSNSDGHEVDFFARDGRQRPYFWAYSHDAAAQTLTRYRFPSPGGAATADTTFSGITAFSAQTYPVTALQDPSTPVYSALYNGATLQSGTVRFYPSMPWIAGGNNITYVHIAGATIKHDLQLVTQTAPSGFTVVVYYTPSPSPPPVPTPAPTRSNFKTWPAQLNTVVQGTVTTTGWWTTAVPASSVGMGGTFLNALLGGSVAQAGGTSQPCYAQALSGGSADTSMGQMTIAGTTYAVSTDGCEIKSTDGGSTWAPVSQPVTIAYEPSGNIATFTLQSNTCGGNYALIGPWSTNPTAVSAVEPVTGKAAGPCSATFSDGQSAQTPALDDGLVDISVTTVFTPTVYHQIDGNGCSSPCTYAATGWAYQTKDGGSTWTTGYGSWTGRCRYAKDSHLYCQSTPPTGTQWYCNLGSSAWDDVGNTGSGGSDAGCGPGDNYLNQSYAWPFPTYPAWNTGPP